MSADPRNASSDEVISRLTTWFDQRFSYLQEFATGLISMLSIDENNILNLTASSRRSMKEAASQYLQRHPVVDGCGMIFAQSALDIKAGHLEWWVREDESRFARYSFGVVPGGDRYYDYEQHEWFVRAYEGNRSTAVGPYIDYLGVEVYVVTLTVPAVVKGRRVGAIGNDLQVDDLERELLPLIADCDSDIVLLSRFGNVLVSNTAEYLPGERVAETPAGFRLVPLPDATDGWNVMAKDRRNS